MISELDTDTVELVPPPLDLMARSVPDVNSCDESGWCWQAPGAPGETFMAFSRDARYAVGQRGVVYDTSGVYLERPTTSPLTTVISSPEGLWVGGLGGIWHRTDDGWTRETSALVENLAIDSEGTLWAVAFLDVLRREDGEWSVVNMPIGPDAKESLMFDDITTLEDGSVWVLGGYWLGGVPDSTLFIFKDDEWREYPANEALGEMKFLPGEATPFAYNMVTNGDEQPRVYAPRQDWQLMASGDGAFATLFWGPDGHLWQSTALGVAKFERTQGESSIDLQCIAAVPWDNTTTLCSVRPNGLAYLVTDERGDVGLVPRQNANYAYDPALFESLPTPVWAQAPEAWATSASDVWRSPLAHFDGASWRSYVEEGDDFAAFQIEVRLPTTCGSSGKRRFVTGTAPRLQKRPCPRRTTKT